MKILKNYIATMQFTFTGKVNVKAESKDQAKEFMQKHIGLVLGGDIHTSLPEEDIGWDFPAHPDKKITDIKEMK